jgi:lipid A ethanolaminephosphotransferase
VLDSLVAAYLFALCWATFWRHMVRIQTIDLFDAQKRVIPALCYVADHGESRGEGGVCLHDAPWCMAPAEETHVPMVIWMSDRFRASLRLGAECLVAAAGQPLSHDNMFSTVLGMVDVTTTARNKALDLTRACHRATTG